MKNNKFYKSIGIPAGLIFFLIFSASGQQDKADLGKPLDQPNIIIILTDDQGYGDVGFNGCRDIPTPNIDRIADNGVVFTNGYVSFCVCAPSRAGLLTGRYQDRFGYSRNPLYRPSDPGIGLPLTEQMMPDALQQAGYNTMAIGKWHLGVHEIYRPWKRGFREFFGFLGGGHRYFPKEFTIENQDSARNEAQSYRTKLIRNEQAVDEHEYITDAFSREAVSFIVRNQHQPFFLYLAYNAPHAPLQATEKYLGRFSSIKNQKRKNYAAMVSAVDDGVGAILNKLEQLNIAENTLVIFLSDNGGPEEVNGSDNGPLRGGKGSLFEGGIRVPFAMQWPKEIPAKTVYSLPVISLDIFATIQANVSNGLTVQNPLDGVDLIPFVKGVNHSAPHEYLFWRQYDKKNFAVVHQSGMKSLTIKDSVTHLFNIGAEIEEKTDISGQNKQTVADLNRQLQTWLSQTIPPVFYGLMQEEEYEKEKLNRKKKQ